MSAHIDYTVLFTHRKTLEITVHPNKSVAVKAPHNTSLSVVNQRINNRARWIKKQLTYFEQFNPKRPPRQYVGGESHFYLGRQYRLKIEQGVPNQVLLKNGYFCIQSSSRASALIKKLLEDWYTQKAHTCFAEMFEQCWQDFNKKNLSKPILKIQSLKTRWGSLSPLGRLTLNTRLIQAPKSCIEYLIIHELCHLLFRNHSRDFYRLLDRKLPDWVSRKKKLEAL